MGHVGGCGDLVFYVPLNITLVISKHWKIFYST